MDTPKEHRTAPAVCGTCATWARCTDERMPDHGECAHRGEGHYTHRKTVCLFKPSRWSVKK